MAWHLPSFTSTDFHLMIFTKKRSNRVLSPFVVGEATEYLNPFTTIVPLHKPMVSVNSTPNFLAVR